MKTWLVTGTSSGFGKALATQLAQKDNTQLIATARKMSDLDYLDQYDHGQIKKILVDVAKPEQIKTAAKEALAFSSEIDVLVNNAGLAEMTEEFLPTFRKQKAGTIVNLSSALGLTTLPTMGYYSATKFAVEGYSDTLRQELSKLGVHVLTVEPSGARTDWAGRSSEKQLSKINDYQQFEAMLETTANQVSQAPGNPKLIAKAIIDAVENKPEIEHLPLGEFAYNGALEKLTGLEKEIKKNKDISLSTDDK